MRDKIIDIVMEVCECENLRENLDIDLIENDILDSLTFIKLVTRLEEEFDIEIQLTQISSETWRHIDSIVELVKNYI